MKLAIHIDGKSIRGSEVQVLLIARAMQQKGHTVVIACRRNGEVEERARELGIPVSSVVPRGDGDFVSALLFAKWLRRGRFDVALLTSWKKSFMASWAARVARTRRIVLRVGGGHSMRAGPGGWKYRRAFLRQVDAIICNAPGVAEMIRSGVPELPGNRVTVILNGLEERPPAGSVSRVSLGVPESAVHCVSVGGLDPRKGFDVLLDALAEAGLHDVHLSIAGSGPALGSLRAHAERLGITARVHFLGHRNDVREILADADVFVLSSRSDSSPVALLEAMGAGLPVIASDVPGVEEALAPREVRGAAGWIVPIGDSCALAEALREVVAGQGNQDGFTRERRLEAQWRVRNWFSAREMTDSVERVLLAAGEP